MSNQTTITITGNLVDDPELRFTPRVGDLRDARTRLVSARLATGADSQRCQLHPELTVLRRGSGTWYP